MSISRKVDEADKSSEDSANMRPKKTNKWRQGLTVDVQAAREKIVISPKRLKTIQSIKRAYGFNSLTDDLSPPAQQDSAQEQKNQEKENIPNNTYVKRKNPTLFASHSPLTHKKVTKKCKITSRINTR